jgi:hypothetical protein
MARNVDSHDESSKPISVPRGSAHGKPVAHSSIFPSTEDTGTRYDHSDAHIHLRSTLGQLGGLYCLGVSSHSSNVFDTVVKQTY